MKTLIGTPDDDGAEEYRRAYLTVMWRISDALRRAGRLRGRR